MEPDRIADILDSAADLLAERGHTKGQLVDYATGAMCAGGAILAAVKISSNDAIKWVEAETTTTALMNYVGRSGEDFGEWQEMVYWNNVAEREGYEVEDAMRHAAKDLRGR